MIEQKGITLITLVVTIVLMIILTGVGISVGLDSVKNAQVSRFKAELKVIHARVNELVEDMELSELNNLGQSIPMNYTQQANEILAPSDSNGYRYFDKELLENDLGISSIDREIIINFSTKDVVDLMGIESEGQIIYRLEDWENITHTDVNTVSPTFSLSKKIYGLNANIIIGNIQYGGNVKNGTISYCLMNGQTEGTWKTSNNNVIPVSVSGTYKVKITDAAGNVSSNQNNTIEITLTNKPQLEDEMVPVKYIEADGENAAYWIITNEADGEWYDYGNSKFANVVPLTGLKVEDEGIEINVTNANLDEVIGKKITASGNLKMWIPRFAYEVPEQGEDVTNIKFLKGTTMIATDNSYIDISTSSENENWEINEVFNNITGTWVQTTIQEETSHTLYELANNNISIVPTQITMTLNGTRVELTSSNFAQHIGKVVTNYSGAPTSITISGKTYTVSNTYRLYWIDWTNKYGDGEGTIYLKADCTGNGYHLKNDSEVVFDGAAATSKIQQLNPSLYASGVTPPVSTNNNMKMVRWLTDTSIWASLKNSSFATKTNYVIGAPSIEMMMDSYNAHYELYGGTPDISDITAGNRKKLFCIYVSGQEGYRIGPDSFNDVEYSDVTSENSVYPDNEIGTTYYPAGRYNSYWIASPSIAATNAVLYVYGDYGGIIYSASQNNANDFCPLVSLKPSVEL